MALIETRRREVIPPPQSAANAEPQRSLLHRVMRHVVPPALYPTARIVVPRIQNMINTVAFLKQAYSPCRQMQAPDNQFFNYPRYMHPTDLSALREGQYENAEIRLMHSHFQPADLIVEIGANIGVVARYAFLRKLNHNGTYVCIEPNRFAHKALRANMELARKQRPHNYFKIIQAALCAPGGTQGWAKFKARRHLTSSLEGQVEIEGPQITIRTPAKSFGQLMTPYAGKDVSLICDVEGAELFMLRDPQGFTSVTQIMIELHGPALTNRPDMSIDRMLKQIEELGFETRARRDNTFYLARTVKVSDLTT